MQTGEQRGKVKLGYRKKVSKGNSLPEGHRGTVQSGHRKIVRKQGTLTNLRAERKGQVRTLKESKQATGTHPLKSKEGKIQEAQKKASHKRVE